MYKSLLIVSLFSLSASAMEPKKEVPSLSSKINMGVATVVGTSMAFAVCTPNYIVTGPIGHTTCTLKVASMLGALYAGKSFSDSMAKPESTK